jgi:hypothetical protein
MARRHTASIGDDAVGRGLSLSRVAALVFLFHTPTLRGLLSSQLEPARILAGVANRAGL